MEFEIGSGQTCSSETEKFHEQSETVKTLKECKLIAEKEGATVIYWHGGIGGHPCILYTSCEMPYQSTHYWVIVGGQHWRFVDNCGNATIILLISR